MLAHHRLSSSLRICLRPFPRPLASTSKAVQCRGIASSLPLKYADAPDPTLAEVNFDEVDEDMLSQPEKVEGAVPTSYREFMEKIGRKFQYTEPLTYLGDTPFPMNPSYKPPPPISDEQKEVMFQLYLSHRLENGPRRLAKRFNMSLKRVNAIIRLKLVEKNFEQKVLRIHFHRPSTADRYGLPLPLSPPSRLNRKLQTGFQAGMERLLGATTHSAVPNERETLMRKQKWLVDTFENNISSLTNNDFTDPTDPTHPAFRSPAINEARSDLQKADMLEQEENRDASVPHYERLYWESVQEDGREPLMPSILQTEKQKAQMRKLNAEAKASKQFLARKPQTEFIRRPRPATFVSGRPRGRKGPITKYLDVGGQFMDLDDRIKALGVSRRRAAKRAQKKEELKQMYVKP